MTARLRAAVSVVLLAGFYLVALAQFAIVAVVLLWLSVLIAGHDAVTLALPLVTLGVGVAALALGRGLTTRNARPQGIPVAPERAPELWQVVREIAERAGTRPPDRIRLLPDAGVRVTEDARLLGLAGGRRTLYVGFPLLQIMTVDRARAVVAHELGHFSAVHRGRAAVTAALGRMPLTLRWYAHVYLAASAGAMRAQEAAADRLAVAVAGHGAATAALWDRPVLEAAWTFFFRRYVSAGWSQGYAPDDLFGGFADFVQARADELDELRNQEPAADRWDLHPPIADRVAALATSAGASGPASDLDDAPATVLLTDPAGAARALQDTTVADGRRPLAWPEFIAAAGTATLRREADQVLREAARTLGRADAGLSEALDVAATGRFARGPIESLLLLAAIHSGTAGWRHSWTAPPRLIGRDGSPLRLGEIAELARSAATVDEARKRLADLGIDAGSAPPLAPRTGAAGAGAVAGLMNVVVDGERSDVVLLNTGLIVVPGVPRLRQREVRPRMHAMLTSVPPEELAAAPGHRFVAYTEFADARLARRVPKTYEITLHGGTTLKIRAGGDTEELGPGWSTLADATLASRSA